MLITIDPAELTVAAETLRSCAIEAADIGSQLWACAQCPMPADLRGVVDQLVVVVDRALDAVAVQLDARAVDLTNRAQIAATDSLAAATVGTAATPSIAVEGGSLVGSWLDGMDQPVVTTADGSLVDSWLGGMDQPVVTTADGSLVDSWFDGMNQPRPTIGGWAPFSTMSIGGNSALGITITNADGSPATSPFGTTMTIGGSSPNGLLNMNRYALHAQDNMNYDVSHQLAPSRLDLEAKFGYLPTDRDLELFSPYTLPNPMTSIFG